MKYGVDISINRLDDLDKRVLATVSELVKINQTPRVLDLGSGGGGLAIALAKAGALVTAVDIDDYQSDLVERCIAVGLDSSRVTFAQQDLVDYLAQLSESSEIVVMQRVLHYLPYATARTVLTQLKNHADILFLAVTGLHTAIAKYYSASSVVVSERWGELTEEGKTLFSITAPLCLYSPEEIEQLCLDCGWTVVWSRVSDFGNIKMELNK